MTIEERATNYAEERCGRLDYATGQLAYKKGATDQKELDKEIINMLIDMLQTSKNYHLGITALDSPEEIIEKRKTRETALIRNIESKIERAKRAMEG